MTTELTESVGLKVSLLREKRCLHPGCNQPKEVEPDKSKPHQLYYNRRGEPTIVARPMKRMPYCYYHRKLLNGHFNFKRKKFPTKEIWETVG